jgi:hypothetical protein
LGVGILVGIEERIGVLVVMGDRVLYGPSVSVDLVKLIGGGVYVYIGFEI